MKRTKQSLLILMAALACALAWAFFIWFEDKLIPEPEEIYITTPHRYTPALLHFQVKACKKSTGYARSACINRVFGI